MTSPVPESGETEARVVVPTERMRIEAAQIVPEAVAVVVPQVATEAEVAAHPQAA